MLVTPSEQIDIAQKRKTSLQTLVGEGIKKGQAAIQIAQILTTASMQNAPVHTQDPVRDRTDNYTAIRSEIDRYSKYVKSDKDTEANKQRREMDAASRNADRAVATGSPPDNSKPAITLEYKTQINGSSIYIRAFDSNDLDTGDMLNAKIEPDSRVYITDINVCEVNRHNGIGSKLLQALEDGLPEGTTIATAKAVRTLVLRYARPAKAALRYRITKTIKLIAIFTNPTF